MQLTTLEVKGKNISVEVDKAGRFFAEVNGQTIVAPALEELKEKLSRVVRNSIAVKVQRWDEGKLLRGVITGIHANTGNYLIKWDGVKGAEQFAGYSLINLLQLTDEDAGVYETLCRESDLAQRLVEEFEKSHRPIPLLKDQVARALNPEVKS